MVQGSRPDRVGEEIRQELSDIIARDVQDPGIGFITLTRVRMTPDLQLARVFYTVIGDDKAKRETAKALDRATPFLRRHVASRVRLRRVPELRFQYDEGIEHQDRVERILLDLAEERKAREASDATGARSDADSPDEPGKSGDRSDGRE